MIIAQRMCACLLLLILTMSSALAADLLEVYQAALKSDPIFQQAVAQQLSTKTGTPISVAALLPSLVFQANPSVTRTGISGTNYRTSIGAG